MTTLVSSPTDAHYPLDGFKNSYQESVYLRPEQDSYKLKWKLVHMAEQSIANAQRRLDLGRRRLERLRKLWVGKPGDSRGEATLNFLTAETELDLHELSRREYLRDQLKAFVRSNKATLVKLMEEWTKAENEFQAALVKKHDDVLASWEEKLVQGGLGSASDANFFDPQRVMDDEKYIASSMAFTSTLLQDREIRHKVMAHEPLNTAGTLDYLQASVDRSLCNDSQRVFVTVLIDMAKKSGLYPKSLIIPQIENESKIAMFSGGYGDVFKAEYNSKPVAVKKLQLLEEPEKKDLIQEALIWRQLRHPNIMPFLGIHENKQWPELITPWMGKGTLTQYLDENPTADRLALLIDIARSLKHIHQFQPVLVHGDLTLSNVLVDDSGTARLTDFGLSWILNSQSSSFRPSVSYCTPGTDDLRAPELLIPNERGNYPKPTPKSDVYAFGLLYLEAYGIRDKFKLGAKSPCPHTHCVALWDSMQHCLVDGPELRPTSDAVLADLETIQVVQRENGGESH